MSGFTHTLYLPLDFNIKAHAKNLSAVADRTQIDIHINDLEMKLTANTSAQLELGRHGVEEIISPPIKKARRPRTIEKAAKPGVWGQPRADFVGRGYKPLGE
ncbi:hypothetical protein HKX48_007373 [Thoreauomyces humboldtii]|nr:hypothetical protein HKX48_007373 [Thoreauomyces humboldtii]